MKRLTFRGALDRVKCSRVPDDRTANCETALFFNRYVLPTCAFSACRAGYEEKENEKYIAFLI